MTNAGDAALAGRRILELADESGAYCGKLFADMGADVIKLERPGGDASRDIPPFYQGEPGANRSLFFLYMNTSKRAVSLDVTKPEGRSLFRRLASSADVIVETLPPGRLEQLGLGFESLRADNPGLVLTSITGFGQTGCHRHFKSSELVAGAMGGSMYVTGEPEDPPVKLAGLQCQMMACATAASSSLIALFHAGRSGRGQHVDISAQETTLAVSHITGVGKWLDDGFIPRRRGTALTASVPSGAYACKDGLVYLMVNRPAHWKALAEWIHEHTGNEEVLLPMFEGPSSNRIEHRELLDIYISDMTTQYDVEEIYQEGQRRHIAFTPVNGAEAVADDAHLAARSFFTSLETGALGRLSYPGAPYRHAKTPWRLGSPAPTVGQHNAEIFCDELQLSPEALAELAAAGVV